MKILLVLTLLFIFTMKTSAIIIDNIDPGFSTVGWWHTYNKIEPFYGINYRQTAPGGIKQSVWTFQIDSGQYEISAQWSASFNRASDAPYTIKNNGSVIAVIEANQQVNGGQFNSLGTFTVESGTLEVILSNIASGPVIADAVKVEAPGSPTPTPAPTPEPTPTPNPTGAIFYISPDGSDLNPGTLSSPFKTFSFAISQLMPGDSLILLDGTYTKEINGVLDIKCPTNARNGTATKPITVRARNERRAYLKSDGSARVAFIKNCSFWVLEGLVGENKDNANFKETSVGGVFHVADSQDISLIRLLGLKPNRYGNNHVFLISSSERVLVETGEAYHFHRHGFSVPSSEFVTLRQNYANSRGYSDIPGGRLSHPCCPNRGDEGIVAYYASNNLFENNISEGNELLGGWGPGNRLYGNISMNDHSGIKAVTNNTGVPRDCRDWILQNNISFKSNTMGAEYRSCINLLVENESVFSAKKHNILANNEDNFIGVSMTLRNILAIFGVGNGFKINDSQEFSPLTLEYMNAFNNLAGNYGVGTSSRTHSSEIDPGMYNGTTGCIVYVPDNSPMKGAGKNGADIGANIIFRYKNGVLTNEKLWNQSTGQFPCGATVAGVNDDATFPNEACLNVHERLNVGVNGCQIP